jgi:hypothetical protein
MAVLGWWSEKEAMRYTEKASGKRLAAAAMALKEQVEHK